MTRKPAPLPDLSSEYPVSPEQIDAYRRDGHLCLRGVCSPAEIAAWAPVIREAAWRINTQDKPLAERDEYGQAFLQILNLWAKDERVQGFTLARRFAKLAADLMGVDAVRLYHDQALFKEPGGTPTRWHQDQNFMPFDSPHLIGMWMAMVPVPAEVGSMRFLSGSHRLGWLGKIPFSAEADAVVAPIRERHSLALASYGAMEPGDVTFHSAWTLHSAAGNPLPHVREIMNIFYLDAAARIIDPPSPDHAIGLKYNVGGRQVGDLPDAPVNPVVYRRP